MNRRCLFSSGWRRKRTATDSPKPKLLSLLLVVASVSACAGTDPTPDFDTLGPFLDSLMLEAQVPGVAFAVFDDQEVLFEYVGGLKSRAALKPIDDGTAFEAASISKPVFAYVVLSLAREGVLDLDAPLETLVPRVPEIAYDPRSTTTVRALRTSGRSVSRSLAPHCILRLRILPSLERTWLPRFAQEAISPRSRSLP